jgi:hypothetical protein
MEAEAKAEAARRLALHRWGEARRNNHQPKEDRFHRLWRRWKREQVDAFNNYIRVHRNNHRGAITAAKSTKRGIRTKGESKKVTC